MFWVFCGAHMKLYEAKNKPFPLQGAAGAAPGSFPRRILGILRFLRCLNDALRTKNNNNNNNNNKQNKTKTKTKNKNKKKKQPKKKKNKNLKKKLKNNK